MKSKLVEVRIVAKRVAWQASGCIGRGRDGATGCGSGEGARRGAGAQGSSAGEAAHERCSARAPGAPSGLDGRRLCTSPGGRVCTPPSGACSPEQPLPAQGRHPPLGICWASQGHRLHSIHPGLTTTVQLPYFPGENRKRRRQ